jgi:hypothetical protein
MVDASCRTGNRDERGLDWLCEGKGFDQQR